MGKEGIPQSTIFTVLLVVAFLLRAICNFTFGKEQTFCPLSGAGLGNESALTALDDLRNKSNILPNSLPWFKFLSIGSKRCSYFDGILINFSVKGSTYLLRSILNKGKIKETNEYPDQFISSSKVFKSL